MSDKRAYARNLGYPWKSCFCQICLRNIDTKRRSSATTVFYESANETRLTKATVLTKSYMLARYWNLSTVAFSLGQDNWV